MTGFGGYEPDGRVNQETECGTVAGYLRHQHQRTEACIDCAHAWVLFSATRPPKNVKKTDSEPTHGLFSTYTYRGCRCEACRDANRVHRAEWKTKR